MVFSVRSTPALAVAAVAVLIMCGGFRLAPSAAAEPAGVADQVSHAAPRESRKTLIQSSRKIAARSGEAIVGVAKTAGKFVGWVVLKTIDGLFDADVDTSDPVRARKDRDLSDWVDSRDKWIREDRTR